MSEKLFDFYAKIHKKPRGNWRPKCEISVTIYSKKLWWRPFVKQIYLIGSGRGGWSYDKIAKTMGIQVGQYIDKQVPFGTWRGYNGILIPSAIWSNPKRSSNTYYDHTYDYLRISESEEITIYYSYIKIVSAGYYSPEDDEDDWSNSVSFYLDWRQGSKPDYSDVASAIAKIPELLEEFIMDGLDSGESEEIIITRESVIQQKIREKSEKTEIKRKIRLE